MWTTTILSLTALAAVISAQPPDCSVLGFGGRAESFPGTDLPVCRTEEEQCCSAEYLEEAQERVEKQLGRALRREFEDVVENYGDEVENLLDYFTDYYPESLLRNLPLSDLLPPNPLLRRLLRRFADNLEIGDDDDDDDDEGEGEGDETEEEEEREGVDETEERDEEMDEVDGTSEQKKPERKEEVDETDEDEDEEANENKEKEKRQEEEEETDEGDEMEDDEETDGELSEESDNDEFDTDDFIEELLDALINILARVFGRNEETVRCIVRVVRSQVDEEVVRRLSALLQQIRRAITALLRIRRFLAQQSDRLEGARLLERCVRRFIELSYCSRCTQKMPPLCFSTCNALVRGCYAPYYTVLNSQYGELWEEVKRIVKLLNSTVADVARGETQLIDTAAVIREVRAQCGVRMADTRRRRSHTISSRITDTLGTNSETTGTNDTSSGSGEEEEDTTGRSRSSPRSDSSSGDGSRSSSSSSSRDTTGDSDSSRVIPEIIDTELDDGVEFIPLPIVDDIFQLQGAFDYGRGGRRGRRRGLRFCEAALNDDIDADACVPLELQEEGDRYCNGVELCTSRCYCFDGMVVTRDNETQQAFDLNDVEDQRLNGVYGADVDDLQEEVDRLNSLGNAVSAFLESDEFTDVDPLTTPTQGGDNNRGGDGEDGGDDESGSAAGLLVSLSSLLLTSIVALLQ